MRELVSACFVPHRIVAERLHLPRELRNDLRLAVFHYHGWTTS